MNDNKQDKILSEIMSQEISSIYFDSPIHNRIIIKLFGNRTFIIKSQSSVSSVLDRETELEVEEIENQEEK